MTSRKKLALFVLVLIGGSSTLPISDLIKGTEPLICGLNEKPSNCVEPCLPTCDTPKAPYCTFQVCLGGCVCREGYIREKTHGKCVKIESCLQPTQVSRNETKEECQENEKFSECATNCQATCARRDVSDCTEFFCAKGCVCKEGFVRKRQYGECVALENCE